MIRTLNDLIESLEAIKADIPVRGLSMTEYAAVAWALRPIDALLERCRDKAEELSWQGQPSDGSEPVLGRDLGTDIGTDLASNAAEAAQ
jgi:hypothetical protein